MLQNYICYTIVQTTNDVLYKLLQNCTKTFDLIFVLFYKGDPDPRKPLIPALLQFNML